MSVKFGKLITKKSIETKLSTMDYRLWTIDHQRLTRKGIALLMMLAMISSLVGVIMICAFVLSHEVNKDGRYDITRQRMLEVKRALIGRLADVSGGEDITSCGGFISDYGEPDSTDPFGTGNFLRVLLDRNSVAWVGLPYDYVNEFWAGYRGEQYLKPNANDESTIPPTPIFIDGWGYALQVSFLPVPNDDEIEIRSYGSDGPGGLESAPDYRQDIVERFYWRRPVEIINNTSPDTNFRIIYPFQGILTFDDEDVPITTRHTFDAAGNPISIPIGLRKIEVRNTMPGPVVNIRMICIPPGEDPYPVIF